MEPKEKNKTEEIHNLHKNGSSSNGQEKNERIGILKTYKIYIDGKFPRTESGRYDILKNEKGETSRSKIAVGFRSSLREIRSEIERRRSRIS